MFPIRRIKDIQIEYEKDSMGITHPRIYEILTCGHRIRQKTDIYGYTNAASRRCHQCGKQSPKPKLTIEERFWEKVDKKSDDECWEWKAGKDSKGYGFFNGFQGKSSHAHRVAWILTNGNIESPELLVCHTCDNRCCVNPNHMFLGTNSDNMKDMRDKGRGVIPKQKMGIENSNGKLTSQDVQEIRDKYSTGKYTYFQLSNEYHVAFQTIGSIVKNKSRKYG